MLQRTDFHNTQTHPDPRDLVPHLTFSLLSNRVCPTLQSEISHTLYYTLYIMDLLQSRHKPPLADQLQ
jgi:hypothetical protein